MDIRHMCVSVFLGPGTGTPGPPGETEPYPGHLFPGAVPHCPHSCGEVLQDAGVQC